MTVFYAVFPDERIAMQYLLHQSGKGDLQSVLTEDDELVDDILEEDQTFADVDATIPNAADVLVALADTKAPSVDTSAAAGDVNAAADDANAAAGDENPIVVDVDPPVTDVNAAVSDANTATLLSRFVYTCCLIHFTVITMSLAQPF